MTVRLKLPSKPQHNTIIVPPIGIKGVQTYNGFNVEENNAAFLIAVRRGWRDEALMRALEALTTNKESSYDLAKRMLVIASEEIGAANPSIIIMIDALLGPDQLEINHDCLLLAVQLLTVSPKCRLFSWIMMTLEPQDLDMNDDFSSLKILLINLDEYIKEGHFEGACRELCRLWKLSKTSTLHLSKLEWEKIIMIFESPRLVKSFKSLWTCGWVPLLSRAERCGDQKVCNLVYKLYNIGCSRHKLSDLSLKKFERLVVFQIHAAWALCHQNEVIETWVEDKKFRTAGETCSATELETLIINHRNGLNLLGIPDDALDRHTAAGKDKGRYQEHFIMSSSVISCRLESLKDIERTWLLKAIQKLKDEKTLRLSFELPEDYFDD